MNEPEHKTDDSPSAIPAQPAAAASLVALTLLYIFLAILRVTAPSDLHEGDQPKQADYVLDIVCNGKWIVQHHADGSMMSKPPLYNWIAAPLVKAFGAEEVFLKAPSLIAGFLVVLMAWDMARKRLGERAAFWGAVFLMLTSMFAKQMYYARTDMLLACFIVMQFWAIERAGDRRQETADRRNATQPSVFCPSLWIFWGAAALGNLTKGPLALLPHLVLAPYWLIEGRFKENYRRIGLWWGMPLALAPLVVWFLLAWHVEGNVVYEHMVKGELVSRFNTDAAATGPKEVRSPFYYLPQVFGRTLPWSLFGLVGLWGALRFFGHTRSMLRFLAIWFFAVLIFFSVIPAKRVDRIFPAVPALSLLGGWAFAEFLNARAAGISPLTSSARLVLRATALFIAGIFFVAGAGIIAFELGVRSSPFTALPQFIRDGLAVHWSLTIACGAILACAGGTAAVMFMRHGPMDWSPSADESPEAQHRRFRVGAPALIVCYLAFAILYQQVLGNWMQTDYARGVLPVCREVRKRAHDDGSSILLLAGSGPAARFYLLHAGLEIQPAEAANRLAMPHPPLYLVGTRDALDKAGAAGKALSVPGVPALKSADASARWLSAVKVPQRP
ncbi:MAG TPA: glycosyltransferase family 39 protein [Planctomycetota bacterium]|nr:glycosyltransferase family 39 protein [Planctomycetota bacterium]